MNIGTQQRNYKIINSSEEILGSFRSLSNNIKCRIKLKRHKLETNEIKFFLSKKFVAMACLGK